MNRAWEAKEAQEAKEARETKEAPETKVAQEAKEAQETKEAPETKVAQEAKEAPETKKQGKRKTALNSEKECVQMKAFGIGNKTEKRKTGGKHNRKKQEKNRRNIKEYTAKFYQKNRINFGMTLLTTILLSVMQVMIAYLLKELMDVSMSGDVGRLLDLVLEAAVFLAAMVAVWMLDRQFKYSFMRKAVTGYRNKAFNAIMGKGISAFNKENTGSYISALTNDVGSIEGNYLQANFSILSLLLQAVTSLGLMMWYSWSLTLVVFLLSVLLIVISLPFGRKMEEQEKEVSEKNAGFMAMVKDLLSGLGVIKSFQAQNEAASLYYDKNTQLEGIKCRRRKMSEMMNIVSFLGAFGVQMGVFIYGAYLSIQGKITPGVVISFVQMMNYIISPIQQLPGLSANRKAAVGLMEKMAGYGESTDSGKSLMELEDIGQGIRFENVSFSYDEGKEVLKDVSLCFEAGKSYAVVGGSGSGKSTLLNLIMGNYPAYGGSVTVGGKEIRDVDPDSIFDVISVIQQNIFIFDDTIGRNICMFKDFDKEQVSQAIRKAGLSRLIEEKGEEYACGEGGAHLSGGEKQRVAIARSLLRKSPVLLVDEATSALDAETADGVTNAILDIQGLTRLVVTHKLEEKTLGRFDEIVVMKNGKVVEQGDFRELMNRRQYFYSLYMVSRE